MEEIININEVAMEVILHAGDGRMKIDEALEKMAIFDFEYADKLLKEAKQEILQAHNAQTKVIQAQVSGEQFEYSLLFVHAQDTVITITTELRMVQKMEPIFKALYQRSKGE